MHSQFAFVASFLFASASPVSLLNRFERSSDAFIEYNGWWSGAAWEKDEGTFSSVTGTFTVPGNISGKVGTVASAWIGIDGHTCYNGALLQTGVDFTVTSDGVAYDPWYEWYPALSYSYNITVSAGDHVKFNVTALSSTSGIASVKNLSNGQSASVHVNSTTPLCRKNAEWIVEDYGFPGEQIPFADFGVVKFTDALARGPHGATYAPVGSAILEIEQDGKVLTNVSVDGDSVTVKYV